MNGWNWPELRRPFKASTCSSAPTEDKKHNTERNDRNPALHMLENSTWNEILSTPEKNYQFISLITCGTHRDEKNRRLTRRETRTKTLKRAESTHEKVEKRANSRETEFLISANGKNKLKNFLKFSRRQQIKSRKFLSEYIRIRIAKNECENESFRGLGRWHTLLAYDLSSLQLHISRRFERMNKRTERK